jgi:hypothetical protein
VLLHTSQENHCQQPCACGSSDLLLPAQLTLPLSRTTLPGARSSGQRLRSDQ